jgi:hypothetical protein
MKTSLTSKRIIGFFAIAILASNCCKRPNAPVPLAKGVYIAGEAYIGGQRAAIYWKNNELVQLGKAEGRDCNATCITLANNSIYVGGAQENAAGKDQAVYWRNDTLVPLDLISYRSVVRDIAVVGSDVYAVGFRRLTAASGNTATIWKNGQASTLPMVQSTAEATHLQVVGSDVYVCGYEMGVSLSTRIWKNGALYLGGTDDGWCQSMKVVGNDVYTCGIAPAAGTNCYATRWLNGNVTKLTNGNQLDYGDDIAVEGADIYVCGQSQGVTEYRPVLWKNATTTVLSTPSGIGAARALVVSGSDVHVVGKEGTTANQLAYYWKNGSGTPLTSTNYTDAEAKDIVLNP